MDLHAFSTLVASEAKARQYFVSLCRERGGFACPRCRAARPYRLGDGRLRCRGCGYTFHAFTGRFLKGCAFDCRQWLWFLKFFALALPTRDIAAQLGVGYGTALRAQDVARRAIVAASLDAAAMYRAGVRPGPGKERQGEHPGESPVFGVIDVKGIILCDVVAECDAETILQYKSHFRLKTASVGNVVYTAPVHNYICLVGCGPNFRPTKLVRHEGKRLPADSHPFWTLAKAGFARYRGLTVENFPLLLKEAEFRYNQREEDLFLVLAKALCRQVPDQ